MGKSRNLSNDVGDGSHYKQNFAFFRLCRDYSNSLNCQIWVNVPGIEHLGQPYSGYCVNASVVGTFWYALFLSCVV